MSNFVTLTNLVLTRLNEVPLDTGGEGFSAVRNVQALAKNAVNNAIYEICQTGQEWPFLKQAYTETLVAGTKTYNFPSDYSSPDYDTFFLKKNDTLGAEPRTLTPLTFEQYVQNHKIQDENGDSGTGISEPHFVYQTYSEAFGVTPVPDAAYEVEYTYWKIPTALVLYNDEAVVPARFNHIIVDGAMMYMMRFRSNNESAMIHKQAFDAGINTMRRVLIDEPLDANSTMIQGKRKGRLT